MQESKAMASNPKVMNPITLVMRFVTHPGENEMEICAGEKPDSPHRLQTAEYTGLSLFSRFLDFSDFSGTDVALEQTALKTQITILERREQ
jgi:hypothetical protein